MASEYVKRRAREQAKRIDKQYGSDSYGGSKWLENDSSTRARDTQSKLEEILREPQRPSYRSTAEIDYDIYSNERRRGEINRPVHPALRRGGMGYTVPKTEDESRELAGIRSNLERLAKERVIAEEAERDDLIRNHGYRDANLYDLTIGAALHGAAQSKHGAENANAMFRAEDVKPMADYKALPNGKFEEFLRNSSEFAGQMIHNATSPAAISGAAAGAAGASILGKLGPQAAFPEEVLSVPTAAARGWRLGQDVEMFRVEAGLAYEEMLEAGVDPETARNVASIVGGVNAGLENMQLKGIGKAYKALTNNPATHKAAYRLAQTLGKYGVDVAKETAQEVAQEGVTIAGVQYASEKDTGEKAYAPYEVRERLEDTAKSAVLPFAALHAPGAVRGAVNSFRPSVNNTAEVRETAAEPERTVEPEMPTEAEKPTAAPQQSAPMSNREIDAAIKDRSALERMGIDPNGKTKSQLRSEIKAMYARGEEAPTEARPMKTQSPSRKALENLAGEMHDSNELGSKREKAFRAADKMFNAEGQRAFALNYNEDVDPEVYTMAFSHAYNDGLSGKRYGATESPVLSDAAYNAAYKAGTVDAGVAYRADLANRPNAVIMGKKDRGLEMDDYVVNNISRDEARRIDAVSRAFGLRAVFVDSVAGGDANAQISNGVIQIEKGNPNPVQFLVGHEITHRMQEISPAAYREFRKIALSDVKNLNKAVDTTQIAYAKADLSIRNEATMDEIAADYAGKLMEDGRILDEFIRRNIEHRTVLEKLRDLFRDIKHKLTGRDRTNAERAEDALTKAMRTTTKTVKKETRKEKTAPKKREFSTNDVQIDEEKKLSIKSMKHDITDGAMKRDLVKHKILTETEADNLIKQISDLIDKMAPFASIVDIDDSYYTKDNRPFSPYKPNSDPLYKISLDFSTLCKKRLLTQFIVEQLQAKSGKALSAEEQLAIRDELQHYAEENDRIEVACALCYVEARRLKAPKQINKFFDTKESVFVDYFAKKNKTFKKEVENMANRMKVDAGYAADTALKDMKPAEKRKIDDAKKRMRQKYNPSAEEREIINRAKKLPNAKFLTQDGLTDLAVNDRVVYDVFMTFVRNATKSKALESAVPYYYGDSKKVSDKLIESMNAENGLRHQSWSDFEIVHLLDNISAVIDLSVREAKVHAYTKVPDFVRVNGKTGIMINLSLIPTGKTGIDENGNLQFSPTEGMDYAVAVSLRDKYHKTSGTIAIGVSDEQIIKLMADPRIDYIIPYHTSGMSKGLRKMAGINEWENYEPYQEEKPINKKAKAPDGVSEKDWHRKPDFSEWFKYDEKRDAGKDGLTIMREAADRYLALCEERGLYPVFHNTKQGHDLSKEENYWKVLIDRKMIDGDGNIIIQQAVKPVFDFDEIGGVVDRAVLDHDENLNKEMYSMISEMYESGELAKKANRLKRNGAVKEALARSKRAAALQKKSSEIQNGIIAEVVSNKQPSGKLSLKQRDAEYMEAVESGDMKKAQKMVSEAATAAGFNDAIPEQTLAYKVRTGKPPKKTIKVYKTFTLDTEGRPTALFVSGVAPLPQGVWLDAQDTWHFNAWNSKLKKWFEYVPSTKNPNTEGGKTGSSVKIPDDEVRQELIRRGFLPEKSEAQTVVALAYRPGWHAGDLPFFPQGGKENKEYVKDQREYKALLKPIMNERHIGETKAKRIREEMYGTFEEWRGEERNREYPYKNVHRKNQVVFECEMAFDIDYTKSEVIKTGENAGKTKMTDMQEMPVDGGYKFATNPMTNAQDLGAWYISSSLKIGRALTQEECDEKLRENGFYPQTWEQGELDLADLGYTGEKLDAARKTLAPVTYDDDGNVIPLSERFNPDKDDIRYSLKQRDAEYMDSIKSTDSEGHKLSEAQQEFFKDSKVRDDDGKLLVMYHGTSSGGFTMFNTYGGRFGLFGLGSYFTANRDVAESYTKKGRGEKPEVYSVYLNIENPIDMDAKADDEKWNEALEAAGVDRFYTADSVTNEDFFKALKEYCMDEEMYKGEAEDFITDTILGMGYDGITHIGGGRYGSKDGPRHRVYIAFEPNQIKNIDNHSPTGDGDIRYSLKQKSPEYMDSIKSTDSEGHKLSEAQQEFFKDSKVRDKNGNLLVVYHGTKSDAFYTFDYRETARTDGGFYGRGFYFTESEGMANMYGGNVLKAYLNIRNPFVFSKEFGYFDDYKGTGNFMAGNVAFMVNAAEKFPELFGDKKTTVIPRERYTTGSPKEIPWADLRNMVNDVMKAVEIVETRNEFGETVYEWEYKYGEGMFDYGLSRQEFRTKQEAIEKKYDAAVDILHRFVAEMPETHGATYYIEDIGDEFTEALKEHGYDGSMQDPLGTEIVAFYPNQIKSIDNLNPTNDDDIRYSIKVDADLRRELSKAEKQGKKDGKTDKEIEQEANAMIAEAYSEMLNAWGAIKPGEKPFRDEPAPARTSPDKAKKVSQTVRTVLEAEATPDVMLPTIKSMIAKGDFTRDVYGDEKALEDAKEVITDKGYSTALADWLSDVRKGVVSKHNTVLGWALYNNAANAGDTKTAITVLNAIVEHQRDAAQALQATRVLKKLSPDGQLYGIARSVKNLEAELKDRYGNKAPDLEIDPELAQNFLDAKTDEERAEASAEIYKSIGRQMPSRFLDKWRAWRYLAMLGNPRTHVRNILGNAFFVPVVLGKDVVATAIESAAYVASGGKTQRTKAMPSAALMAAAMKDYPNVMDKILEGGKYNESETKNAIEEGRVIFDKKWQKPIEYLRKKNSEWMQNEDMWFSKPHYAIALAQYCKANGISAKDIESGKIPDKARAYAIAEAQKATYRDTNAFSEMISDLGRYNGSNKVKRVGSLLVEGVLPFRKTPANILARGVEYSPLGLLKALTYDVAQAKSGKVSSAQVIDHISAGLTGSGLLALGAYMALEGMVRGSDDDDKKKANFDKLVGHQKYSIELPNGKSMTLDWLAPEALPFFVGVNFVESMARKDDEFSMESVLSAIGKISDPMLEMSCLSSLNALFDSVGYAADNGLGALPTIIASATTSLMTQVIPTLAGQAERSSQPERMTTFIDENNKWLTPDMQYAAGKASARFPGWDFNQVPYINAWGEKEVSPRRMERGFNSFLNPAYMSEVKESDTTRTLESLYNETGDGRVFPERAKRKFAVDGEDKILTAQEYTRYATLKGRKSKELVDSIVSSKGFAKLDNAQKVDALSKAYSYADNLAKAKVSDYTLQKSDSKIRNSKAGESTHIIAWVAQSGIDGGIPGRNGKTIRNSESLLRMEALYKIPEIARMSSSTREDFFVDMGIGKTVAGYTPQKVSRELASMR